MKTSTPKSIAVRRLLYTLIATTTLAFLAPPNGWAMLAPSRTPVETGSAYDRASDMKTVQAALESKVVRQGLKDYGLSDAEIQSRLSKLSDKQVHQLAMSSHGAAPGGFVVELLVLVVLVLLIIFLVKRV